LRHKFLLTDKLDPSAAATQSGWHPELPRRNKLETNTGKKFSVKVLSATTVEAVFEVLAANEQEAELAALDLASVASDSHWKFSYQEFYDGRGPDGWDDPNLRIGDVRPINPKIVASDE
jgi:hypothetical protein